jgi:hypothetical protein
MTNFGCTNGVAYRRMFDSPLQEWKPLVRHVPALEVLAVGKRETLLLEPRVGG